MRKSQYKSCEPQPVYQDGIVRCDSGRTVQITSCGGALVKAEGIVVTGPYRLIFHGMKARFDKNGKKTLVEAEFITDPYWLVRLENGREIHFAESEITFI